MLISVLYIYAVKITDMEQKHNKNNEDFLKQLFADTDRSIANLKQIKDDMKRDGVVGICSKCGCNRYADKEHKCK